MTSDVNAEDVPEGLNMSLDQIIQNKKPSSSTKDNKTLKTEQTQQLRNKQHENNKINNNYNQGRSDKNNYKQHNNTHQNKSRQYRIQHNQQNYSQGFEEVSGYFKTDKYQYPNGFIESYNGNLQQRLGPPYQDQIGNVTEMKQLYKQKEKLQDLQQQDSSQLQKNSKQQSFDFETDFYNAPLKGPQQKEYIQDRNKRKHNNSDIYSYGQDPQHNKFKQQNKKQMFNDNKYFQNNFQRSNFQNNQQIDRKIYLYRKHLQCYKKDNGEVALKFHDTEIVKVNLDGDVFITTNGYKTLTTHLALNDVLNLIDIKINAENNDPVKGEWKIVDGRSLSRYSDDMILKGKGAPTYKRASIIFDFFKKPDFIRNLAANKRAGTNVSGISQISRAQDDKAYAQQQQQQQYGKAASGANSLVKGDASMESLMQNMQPLMMAAMMNPYMMQQMQYQFGGGGGGQQMSMFNNYNSASNVEDQNQSQEQLNQDEGMENIEQ